MTFVSYGFNTNMHNKPKSDSVKTDVWKIIFSPTLLRAYYLSFSTAFSMYNP